MLKTIIPIARRSQPAAKLTAALLMLSLPIVPAAIAANGYLSGEISNNLNRCKSGSGPALLVTVAGIKASEGQMRVQSYRATKNEWMEGGKWLNRIETPAKAGTMSFCLPVPENGTYGVAVRHDLNGNGKTDITKDGGGISNNPSINIFNLGKPSYTKVGVEVRGEVKAIRIQMKYM
jgi:uncharacterized protein (DUF2141 family)